MNRKEVRELRQQGVSVEKTVEFLKESLGKGHYMQAHPSDRAYRLEHSYRVANIGKAIAEQEGFDPTEMVIACLLHDISYCREFHSEADWQDHGRMSAKIARPFLTGLGLPQDRVQDICYGIAIHVDDKADFEGERTPFALTVSDADNLDRFDAYRIYETLLNQNFRDMTWEEKVEKVRATLEKLSRFREMKLATKTADEMWKERIGFYISFYEKLNAQLAASREIL